MQKHPVVGLKVCHEAIVEEKTHNVTLVNCFRELALRSLPTALRSFVACLVLTDGNGNGKLTLKITEPADLDDIWEKSWDISIKDPLKEIWYLLPINGCTVERPGSYQVSAWLDGEPLARTVVRISQKGA